MDTTQIIQETDNLVVYREQPEKGIPHYRYEIILNDPDKKALKQIQNAFTQMFHRDTQFTMEIDIRCISNIKMSLLFKQAAYMHQMKDRTRSQTKRIKIICSQTGKSLLDFLFKIAHPVCPVTVEVYG